MVGAATEVMLMAGKRRALTPEDDSWRRAQFLVGLARLLVELLRWSADGNGPDPLS
jgi:hypothetical protein